MKQKKKLMMIVSFVLVGILAGVGTASTLISFESKVLAKQKESSLTSLIESHQIGLQMSLEKNIQEAQAAERAAMIVYDNMTLTELTDKLNRVLKADLAGKGETFAAYSLEKGVDPYIAVAIALEETGCNSGTCSRLTRLCNNVGGMKGTSSCGGSYMSFATMEDGIKAFINNLSKNYFSKGLTTPELINKRYASSTTWSTKVNRYINTIRAS